LLTVTISSTQNFEKKGPLTTGLYFLYAGQPYNPTDPQPATVYTILALDARKSHRNTRRYENNDRLPQSPSKHRNFLAQKKKNPVSDSVIKTTSDMCEIPSTVQPNICIKGRTQKDGYRNRHCTSIEAKQLFLEFTFHCLDTEQK